MIRVEGHKNLYRDDTSGAIINHDSIGYNNYKRVKNRKKLEEQELKDIRSEIDELKMLLLEVLDKKMK
tara:strand:- start:2457 stop:2660 length:204 start_codon:yes stop_codon:yes gene_type:complete